MRNKEEIIEDIKEQFNCSCGKVDKSYFFYYKDKDQPTFFECLYLKDKNKYKFFIDRYEEIEKFRLLFELMEVLVNE